MLNQVVRIVCFCIFVLVFGIPSLAQNTKGDKPGGSTRETRFKTPKNSQPKRKSGARINQKGDKAGARATVPQTRTQSGEKPGRPMRPAFYKSKPPGKTKPWKGDISGRRIKSRSSGGPANNVYPQPPSINYSSEGLKESNRKNANTPGVRQGTRGPGQDRPKVQKRRVVPRSLSGRIKNIYSQKSLYVNKKSLKPTIYQTSANRSALTRLNRYQGLDKSPIKNRKVVPRSASASFMARRSPNAWAHFPKPKRKQEQSTSKDLAGKKLRAKNFVTQIPVLINPTQNYRQRKASGERPYKGPAAGGYVSRTKTTERAWRGDISKRIIRGGKPPGKSDKPFPGILQGGGYRSATQSGENRQGKNPLSVRAPGNGAARMSKYQGNIRGSSKRGFGNQGEGFSGNIVSRRLLTGGGSISGKSWNNKGIPVQGKSPGIGGNKIGTYQGNIRAGRRAFSNQGESYSGEIKSNRRRSFSNQGEEYTGGIKTNGKGGFSNQGEQFTGNIKARRPQKGGGSVSGKLWNNKNTPVQTRIPEGGNRIATFQGNIRAGKKVFRDQGEEFSGNIKTYRKGALTDQGEEYSGNIKARRPLKGGGSVSGKLWNNNNTPVVVRIPAGSNNKIATYKGNISGGSPLRDQGEEYAGNLKVKRPDKGGGSVSGKLWNNDESPLTVRAPKSNQGGEFKGNLKFSPKKFSKNPRADEYALKGVKPSAASVKAGEYSKGIRRNWDYIKNPSSADEAQRIKEHGKAFARSTDFQGNVKMKKFTLFDKNELHPDAKFVKLNQNNVDEEKDMLTNFKLWWARLFRKNETQPDHLKEKGHKPRYDKEEAGMWYE